MDEANNSGNTEGTPNLRPGSTLAHYRIVEQLGAGGMGEVYLAEDTRLERQVALKSLAPALSDQSQFRNRFVTEARAAARLSHPNICSVYAIEEVADAIFIIMEYVDGLTLKQIIKTSLSEPNYITDIAVQCCDGLQAAHEAGIIHRDIKSSNIMVDRSGRVKIMDFGLAKIAQVEGQTQTGAAMGTYQYMSPQQISGEQVDHRSDLYSMGVVFYELITGELPHIGDNVAALAYQIVHERPKPLASFDTSVPPSVLAVVEKALNKQVADRYQSAAEISADLSVPGRVVVTAPLPTAAARASIAVFPLRNLSPDSESEYLSDGICEDLITKLSKIRNLQVASRTAVFRFKGKDFDPVEVAGKLGVHHFLDGSVRRFGDDLRISVQLSRTSDTFVVWSDTFDRKCENVLHLQADIAEMIAEALGIELTRDEQKTVIRKPTANPEAYDYYLRGKFHAKKRGKATLETAIHLFEKAVELDPDFAPAIAGLSQVYQLGQTYGYTSDRTLLLKSRDLATKAVEQDPNSAEAHISLGLALRTNDVRKSISELRAAVALEPGNSEARHFLAHLCVFAGMCKPAMEEEKKALVLDPFQPISRAYLCHIMMFLGRSDDAEKQYRILAEDNLSPYLTHATEGWLAWCHRDWGRAAVCFENALQIEPDNMYEIDHLCDCYRRMARLDEAKQLAQRGMTVNPHGHMLHARLGQVLAAMDDSSEAEQLFSQARENLDRESRNWLNPKSVMFQYDMAWISAIEGQGAGAIEYLREAARQCFGNYAELRVRPDWECLHEESGFDDLVAEIKRLGESGDATAAV